MDTDENTEDFIPYNHLPIPGELGPKTQCYVCRPKNGQRKQEKAYENSLARRNLSVEDIADISAQNMKIARRIVTLRRTEADFKESYEAAAPEREKDSGYGDDVIQFKNKVFMAEDGYMAVVQYDQVAAMNDKTKKR